MSEADAPGAPIDWSAPWLAPYRSRGERVEARWRGGVPLPQALDEQAGPGLPRFVPSPGDLPQGYERHVHDRGEVPTREGLHDFFNGLVWLHHPALKRALNRLHAQAPPAPVGRRGPLRDALTLLDENGALLDAPRPLVQALRERAWSRLFTDLRPLWADARLTIVGHGLLEQLQQPRKPLTAHVLVPGTPLTSEALSAKPFLPLPVLGVPGWWPPNEEPSFYDDRTVFRPAR